MSRALFVTGIDTGVGKTVVAAAMLQAFRRQGLRAIGMKPVASGCTPTAQGWRNDDALMLQQASDPRPDYALVNPYALPEATAPQIAADHAGVRIELAPMVAAFAGLAAQADVVLVEGVGGWLAPLSDALDQSDLARALGIDEIVLVVGLRLGCINHARLSERAILADGFRLGGWICNSPDDRLEHADAYFSKLEQAMDSPCLGRLGFAQHPTPESMGVLLHTAF
ncbi:dethiobiotin synthase [Arenimonas sp.]|uniref:dethiobiotin synthase n=1 Tax=Arenimonas sp. TaxID=1872635 RepID=UPI0039E64C81